MKLEEISSEDIYRLVSIMERCDEVMYEAHSRWDDVFTVDGFCIIKSALFFWNRIAKELEISTGKLDEMPVYDENEVNSDESNDDSIVDFIYSSNQYFDVTSNLLEKLGVSVDYTELTPGMLNEAIEDAAEEALAINGEPLDRIAADAAGRQLLKEVQLTQINRCFPDEVDGMISFVEENGCYAEGMTCFYSKRIGRLYEHMELLKGKLPERLLKSIVKLTAFIFNPLYLRYPALNSKGMNAEGEYCCVFSTGYIDQTGEEIHEVHMRPYLNVAAALLHRLLTEAEGLAPEILLADKTDTEIENKKEVESEAP